MRAPVAYASLVAKVTQAWLEASANEPRDSQHSYKVLSLVVDLAVGGAHRACATCSLIRRKTLSTERSWGGGSLRREIFIFTSSPPT